jgi:hypothetical protein
MKQLEEEQQQNEWAAMSLKNGGVMYNKRTGEYQPIAEFGAGVGQAGSGYKSQQKTVKVIDSNGLIIPKLLNYEPDTGLTWVWENGQRVDIDPSKLNIAPETAETDYAAQLRAQEGERDRMAKAKEQLYSLNLPGGPRVAFRDKVPKEVSDIVQATFNVNDAYKNVFKNQEFLRLTTKGKTPEENAKKAVDYYMWSKQHAVELQPFMAAQANILNSGVMNEGEAKRYIVNQMGLPEDIFSNPSYNLDKNVKSDLAGVYSLFLDKIATQAVTAADIVGMQARVAEIARAYPNIIDPSRPREALRVLTEAANNKAKRAMYMFGAKQSDIPPGTDYIGVDDPQFDTYFSGIYPAQEEATTGVDFSTPPIGMVGQPPTPQPTQVPARVTPTKPIPQKSKNLKELLDKRKKTKQGGAAPVISPTPATKSGNTSWKAFKGG